jgi:hypothetical protein
MSAHVTEEQAVSLADGQAVPAEVAAHAEGCAACAERIADHALLSLSLQLDIQALAVAAPELEAAAAAGQSAVRSGPSSRAPAAQLPSSKKPLAIGLLVAIAASIPALPSVARDVAWLSGSSHFSAEAVRQMLSALLHMASAPVWSLAATLSLLGLGVLVAAHATRLERDGQEAEGATK